jgi:hypothetical protein
MHLFIGKSEIAAVCAACATGQRLDGRKLDELQTLELQTDPASQASGSARLRMGDSEVLVGVKVGGGVRIGAWACGCNECTILTPPLCAISQQIIVL